MVERPGIYLDLAATTRGFTGVVAAMMPYWTEIYSNPSSSHSYGQAAALEAARGDVAEALGCRPKEVVFTSCGSESDNLALARRSGWHCAARR